ncbi:precorrin-6Y C5,15-methyltransferase (decarboxylating) [Lachnospiraceae bacterium C10]|nr:precorrin-6Y C5,15-methyltransferase (decarboxylating) [Lachnospiraceae bacterium C10]
MSKIVIFSGTTEGRELAGILSSNHIPAELCVATEYGSAVMPALPHIKVHEGRQDAKAMRELYHNAGATLVIDATHPYASVVTQTIKESVSGTEIEYLRLLRPNDSATSHSLTHRYSSAEECAKALAEMSGNVFLTTGSKDLFCFTGIPQLKDRLTARVLPGIESLSLCLEAGLSHRQIIAMQGPFSLEMNREMFRNCHARHLVTKESGRVGGVDTKLLAAEELGLTIHIINRPAAEEDTFGSSMEAVLHRIEEKYAFALQLPAMEITLAGIGCGNEYAMTREVEKAIEEATVVFGAKRLLETIRCQARTYPYYLSQDILPKLKELYHQHPLGQKVVILFSGDSGCYSGAARMKEALAAKKDSLPMNVRILPGVSSIQMMSARLAIPWQDAAILSLHGKSQDTWQPLLSDAIRYHNATFFLTSGYEDIEQIRLLLPKDKNLHFYAGYNLSYEDEVVTKVTEETPPFVQKGLYVGVIQNNAPQHRPLLPWIKDEEFLRGNVPMTKEEIRKLTLCQLNLKEDSVLYDIGAGTGSICVQAACLSPRLSVYALEYKEEALQLIKENAARFHAYNLHVIPAFAPEGLQDLPPANSALIGGSKGQLPSILKVLHRMNPKMQIVVNVASLETLSAIQQLLAEEKLADFEMIQLQSNRVKPLGNYHLFDSNNPVYLCSFKTTERI